MLLGLYHLQYRHGPTAFTPVHHSLPLQYLSLTLTQTQTCIPPHPLAHSNLMNPACQIRLEDNRIIAH